MGLDKTFLLREKTWGNIFCANVQAAILFQLLEYYLQPYSVLPKKN